MVRAMRQLAIVAATLAALTMAAGSAHAIYIEADLPITLAFSDSNTKTDYDSVSGVLLTAGDLFLGLGIGYEMYTAKWKASGGGSAPEVGFDYLDIVWAAPVPVINLSVGAGVGSAVPKGDLGDAYDQGGMTQFFVRVGIPIAKVFDVHLGYHMVSGKMAGKSIGGFSFEDVKLDGSLTTIGARFGF